jgi:Na+/H+ antiporter NhaD/arsenite permease-like protein
VALAVLRIAFRHQVPWHQGPEERAVLRARIAEFDPWALVEDRRVLLRSGVILGLTVLGFALAQWLGLGMDFIAMAGGTAALLFAGHSVEESINKVNWTVILFFMGLFLIVGCVEATGALEWLAQAVVALSGQRQAALIPLLCGFSALASSIVDNIPVAATLIPIVKSMGGLNVATEPLWWSLVIGANLGGNGTPIGSISCVIAIHTLHKEAGVVVGWGQFLKLGGTIMLLQVAGAMAYLLALYALGAFSLPFLQLGG